MTTAMVSTLTTDQLATEAQNGTHQESTTQAVTRDQMFIIAQIQQLTTRQREVLDLVVQGLTNKEIARETGDHRAHRQISRRADSRTDGRAKPLRPDPPRPSR
ncbi:MAG: LuxR C-terminal-related transcriptional regulator [Caldilineaceae bacterium]